MSDPLWLGLALVLLALGVVGSVVPVLPGPLLSVAGVVEYWWSAGYADPGPLYVAGVVVVGLGAAAVDWFGGAVATRAGGASTATAVAAAVVGALGFLVAGPLGIVVGVAVAVFAVEYRQRRDVAAGLRASGLATLGLLASTVVQVLVTASILLSFLVLLAL